MAMKKRPFLVDMIVVPLAHVIVFGARILLNKTEMRQLADWANKKNAEWNDKH